MKRWLGLLLVAFALPALAAPPSWDLSNTFWTVRIRDLVLGYQYDGNIRFFTQNTPRARSRGACNTCPPTSTRWGNTTSPAR